MFVTREAKDREEQVKLSTLQRVTNTHLKTHIFKSVQHTVNQKTSSALVCNEATLLFPMCNSSCSNNRQNGSVLVHQYSDSSMDSHQFISIVTVASKLHIMTM